MFYKYWKNLQLSENSYSPLWKLEIDWYKVRSYCKPKNCAAVFNQRLSTSIFASLVEWAKADIIFGLPEDRTSSLLVLTTSATNKLLFIEYFWYFQGRQIGGLQRVKPNYAHPFASRASFFGAKPPQKKAKSISDGAACIRVESIERLRQKSGFSDSYHPPFCFGCCIENYNNFLKSCWKHG